MESKRYRFLKPIFANKIIGIVLLLLFVSLIHINLYAQEQESDINSNTITFLAEQIDYDNRLLLVNAKIHLSIDANDENIYLILPIKDTPGLHFFIEPNNCKRTIMHGFLSETEYLLLQFSPSSQSEVINLSINDIQMFEDQLTY